MSDHHALLSRLPQIGQLAARPEVVALGGRLGQARVTELCRVAVTEARERCLSSGQAPDPEAIVARVVELATETRRRKLGRVINATGVLVHTNLGRAPLGGRLLDRLAGTLGGYCNLEIDVATRDRGVRGQEARWLAARLAGAEDALIVNNNAAAVFLVLAALARDREVLVSRGELVQIGGGFRIPELLASTGARLVEIGTTNVTRAADYRAAVGPLTAVILHVHQANFRQEGFVARPTVAELAEVSRGRCPLVVDVGSGHFPPGPGPDLTTEPSPREHLAAGADLVCFSGDKLLGGCQSGIIAGCSELVAALAHHPVMRALRPDKLTYAILEEVLAAHLDRRVDEVPLWHAARTPVDDLVRDWRAESADLDLPEAGFALVPSRATFGGGSAPGETIPSVAVELRLAASADELAAVLAAMEPPVLGIIQDGRLRLDLRTVLPEDRPVLARSLAALGRRYGAACQQS